MIMKYRVAQIIPYFGRWPVWIDLYFYSCSKNPMVDFIFYTDCPVPQKKYDNIFIHKCSYNEYKSLVGERLGIEFNVNNPYKLTDLKPFLGLVHKAELQGYDFWGFGDLDLVYGDLSIVVNERNLKKYDVITTHSYHIAGHFTILRNNDKYRNLCLSINDWDKKLCDDKHYALDEGEWSDILYPQIHYVRALYKRLLKKIGVSYWGYMEAMGRMLHWKKLFSEFYTTPAPQKGEEWEYHCDTNKVYSPKGKELPYLHFLFFKKTPYYDTDVYWRDGFYKIDNSFDNYKRIIFNNNEVGAVLQD